MPCHTDEIIKYVHSVDIVPSACSKMGDVAFFSEGAGLVKREGKEPDYPSTIYKPFYPILPDLHWPLK